ncbi:hypothetical protein WJX81_001729 [Elliptochloris bilobata]|uniref:Ubiquinol oxidase n=1 Tax=Elliptochloris bilobata TaxID=381761 RepID=A0AAW1RL03_9CHLO
MSLRTARRPSTLAQPRRTRQALLVLLQGQKGEKLPTESYKSHLLSSQDGPGHGECDVFIAPDGNVREVLCYDYGFRSGFGRLYQGGDGEIPKGFFALGWENYRKEFKQLRRSFRYNEYSDIRNLNPPTTFLGRLSASAGKKVVGGLAALDRQLEDWSVLPRLTPQPVPADIAGEDGEMHNDRQEIRSRLRDLQLDDELVWKREEAREASPEWVKAPWFIQAFYILLCWGLDKLYAGRPLQRFWFLETVARMPYFSYISMLHLYESLGWWRAGAELRRIHFAEEWNELHHLQIMESLGGDQYWVDRFLAQHAAVFYYWTVVLFFAISPSWAYTFSELVEGHATDTYDEFVAQNADKLKALPPPRVALEYYMAGDLYLFDELQTTGTDPKRRPSCNSLYDVFRNIADDEREHVKTMTACRDYSIVDDLARKKLTSKEPTLPKGATPVSSTTASLVK